MSAGVVVWLTGLPASGKSTLARATRDALRTVGLPSVILDGDEVRAALVPQQGHDAASRETFHATLACLAALIARQELIVLVAATAHRRAWRDAARALAPRFVEVHVATPVEECMRRDPKHLYAGARNGTLRELPGFDLAYEPPRAPDVLAVGGNDLGAVVAIVEIIAATVAPHTSTVTAA